MRVDWQKQCYRLDLWLCVSVCALHDNQPWLSETTAGTWCPQPCGVFLSVLETQRSLETPLKVASITALKTCTPAKSPKQGLCCTHHMSHPWRKLLSHWLVLLCVEMCPQKSTFQVTVQMERGWKWFSAFKWPYPVSLIDSLVLIL